MGQTALTAPTSATKKPRLRKILLIIAVIAVVMLAAVLIINSLVVNSGKKIISATEAAHVGADCILVLGAGVNDDGSPSYMLADRLDTAIELYRAGVAPKLLMSGDHGRKGYDEVNTMKDYALQQGVPSADIFMDHAGFATYDSIYRARDVFQADKVIIVSQRYHLYRALYIAEALGLDAYGVAAEDITYSGQWYRDLREVAARCKDFIKCLFRPEPALLGEVIPVSGNGDLTNDRPQTKPAEN